MEILLLIGALGLFCGIMSGVLGIGGGIIMAPLLLYIPPLFGLQALEMRTVAGLTIFQGLLACIFGVVAHNKFKRVSRELSCWMGAVIFGAALVGGVGANYVSNRLLLMVFGALAFLAAILMFAGPKAQREPDDIRRLEFKRGRAVAVAGGVGLLGGLVGQGGSFILIPLMTAFVKIPTRIALASNLAIVSLATAAAFSGKALTGQIDWLLAFPLLLTVVPAAYLGGHLSQRLPVLFLRRTLAGVIALAAVRIWYSLFS